MDNPVRQWLPLAELERIEASIEAKYSQSHEESHIVNYLNGFVGRFLDIGAYDGKTFSNTYRLYELGWSGVLVEPDEEAWAKLVDCYQSTRRVSLVKAAIGATDGPITFYTSHGGAVSTTNPDHRDLWTTGGGISYDEITVQSMSVDTLLSTHGDQYDFVNLDVEGTNIAIMKLLPLDRIKPKLISIEFDHRAQEVIEYCAQYGLTQLIYQSNENVILGRPL